MNLGLILTLIDIHARWVTNTDTVSVYVVCVLGSSYDLK